MFEGLDVLSLIAGVVLLVAGRRLYWLLVGLVGFVVGFILVGEVLEGPVWAELLGGLLAGLLASGVAVFFQRIAIAVAGFLIGGLTVLWWAEKMSWGEPWWVWILAAVVGLAGAWLVRALFEVGLILLSSVLGATFVLEALRLPTRELSLFFLVLVTSGVLIQLFRSRRRKREQGTAAK